LARGGGKGKSKRGDSAGSAETDSLTAEMGHGESLVSASESASTAAAEPEETEEPEPAAPASEPVERRPVEPLGGFAEMAASDTLKAEAEMAELLKHAKEMVASESAEPALSADPEAAEETPAAMQPLPETKEFSAFLRRKQVQLQVSGMGLVIVGKSGKMQTLLFQTLLSWELTGQGFEVRFRNLLALHCERERLHWACRMRRCGPKTRRTSSLSAKKSQLNSFSR
jgi:hypothetical protein